MWANVLEQDIHSICIWPYNCFIACHYHSRQDNFERITWRSMKSVSEELISENFRKLSDGNSWISEDLRRPPTICLAERLPVTSTNAFRKFLACSVGVSHVFWRSSRFTSMLSWEKWERRGCGRNFYMVLTLLSPSQTLPLLPLPEILPSRSLPLRIRSKFAQSQMCRWRSGPWRK